MNVLAVLDLGTQILLLCQTILLGCWLDNVGGLHWYTALLPSFTLLGWWGLHVIRIVRSIAFKAFVLPVLGVISPPASSLLLTIQRFSFPEFAVPWIFVLAPIVLVQLALLVWESRYWCHRTVSPTTEERKRRFLKDEEGTPAPKLDTAITMTAPSVATTTTTTTTPKTTTTTTTDSSSAAYSSISAHLKNVM